MTLWICFQFDNVDKTPHRREKHILYPIQRASLCICQRGSYTLEAAVVIPLVAIYLVTLLFFFSIIEIQCDVDEAILYAGRKIAVESSVVESEEVLFLSAEAYLQYALQDSALVEKYVQNGVWRVSLWKSHFYDEEIILCAEYTIKFPIPIPGIGTITMYSQNYFRKWLGDHPETEEGEFVYVTLYGETYHGTKSCRVLQISVKETSIEAIPFLRGLNGQCYYECTKCEWQNNLKERVYYTDYGTRYHKDISCSAIKRLVEKIKLEEIGERRPCSFCYE